MDRVVIDAHLHLWNTERLRYEQQAADAVPVDTTPKPTFTLGLDA